MDQSAADQQSADPQPASDIQPTNIFLQIALQNVAAATATEVANLNNNLKTNYLSGFSDWASAVLAGKQPNTNPPQPPTGYEVATDANGWSYAAKCDTLVCAMPPVPDQPKVWVPPVLPEPDNVRNVPPGDTMPVGYVLTAPDGSHWQKQASPTPFGMAYYYAKVA